MRRILLGLLALSAFSFGALLSPVVAQTRKIEFPFRDRAQLAELEATGAYEIVEVHGNRAVALHTVDASQRNAPQLAGVHVLAGNIDDELARFRAAGNVGKYHTPDSAAAELKALADKYPTLCKVESIGKTFEGRDMWVLRITGAADTTKVPRMLIFGLIHAREWISQELPFHVIHKLLDNYATDPAMKALVDGHAFWIMPVTNPDGLAYSQTSYSMWRKNRSKAAGTSQVGVDVNRNFEVGWGAGSSASPSSDVYRGTKFNSELETQNLLALVAREKFNVSLSLHSYSELILYPWGFSENDPPGKDTFVKHGQEMAKANSYRPGSVAQILYTAGGATDDTFFSKYGCWTWTFELAQEFAPPDTEIQSICDLNWPAVLHLMNASNDLAATPPPPAPAASAIERLAQLEGAWRDARLAPIFSAPGAADPLTTLMGTVSSDMANDPFLAGEVERRAHDANTATLYKSLLGGF